MATIAGIAGGSPDFGILVSAVQFIDAEKGTNYLATLDDASAELTVFAPTDAAFGNLAVSLGFDGDPADEAAVTGFLTTLGADLLETVVTYHIVGGSQFAADVVAADELVTLQGGTIDTTNLPTLGDKEPDLIDPSLVTTDLAADNGVVHVIDQVLLPVDLEGNDAASITGTVIELSGASGFDDNGGDFDVLRSAVIKAGLAETLDDAALDATVFAPNDAAFLGLAQALGFSGTSEGGAFAYINDALRLLSGGEDPTPLLTEILTYHVAGEGLQASEVLSADMIATLQGGMLTVDAASASLGDAEPDVADPMIIGTDVVASNGIVHVLDGVLLPADLPDFSGNADLLIGSNQADMFKGGAGADLIDGNRGADMLGGGRGADLILGGRGKDEIKGGKGADTIDGGAGRDEIGGGRGADVIVGGGGDDMLKGGKGADTFVFDMGDGDDAIIGFGRGADVIDVTAFGFGSFDELSGLMDEVDGAVEIALGDDQVVTLLNTHVASLSEEDFLI